jgi:hypothetical protein
MNKPRRPGPEEWRQIIDGQTGGGLTVAAYCLERGITRGSFYTWKRWLRSPAKRNRLAKPVFAEVTPPKTSASGVVEICLHGERRLMVRAGFDHDLLIDLIRTLEGAA